MLEHQTERVKNGCQADLLLLCYCNWMIWPFRLHYPPIWKAFLLITWYYLLFFIWKERQRPFAMMRAWHWHAPLNLWSWNFVLVTRILRWTESWSCQWSACWRRCWEIQTFCLRREKLPPTFWGAQLHNTQTHSGPFHSFFYCFFKMYFLPPQHSFSRWARGRPVENRGHLTDGERATSFCWKYLCNIILLVN